MANLPDLFTKEGDNYVPYTQKVVLEADLLQVKGSLEGKVTGLEAQVTDAKKSADGNLQRAITAEGAAEAVKKELEPLKGAAARVTGLEQQLAAATTGRTEMETRLLVTRRSELVGKYKITDQAKVKELEGMSATDLDNLEKAFVFTGASPSGSSRFDSGGGGGGGDSRPQSGRSMIKDALAAGAGT